MNAYLIGLAIIQVFIFIGTFVYLYFRPPAPPEKSSSSATAAAAGPAEAKKSAKASSKKSASASSSHPSLISSCKGHSGPVLDFTVSKDGKTMATTSDDRTVFLWNLESTSKALTFSRVNIELDHATHISYSPDGKSLAMIMDRTKQLQIMQLEKDTAGKYKPKVLKKCDVHHKDSVHTLEWAPNGFYLLTCTSGTEIKMWDNECRLLDTINTNSNCNYAIDVASNSLFFAVATFMPEVKIFEILMSKEGGFQKVQKAMVLAGKGKSSTHAAHSRPIHGVSFSSDGNSIATAGHDGLWKVWNIAVRYKQGEDPAVVTGFSSDGQQRYSHVAFCPNDAVIAVVSVSGGLMFYNAKDTRLIETIPPAEIGAVKKIKWLPHKIHDAASNSEVFALAILTDDGKLRLWKCPATH